MITVGGQRERLGRTVAAVVRRRAGAITTFVTLLLVLLLAVTRMPASISLAVGTVNPRWQPARR